MSIRDLPAELLTDIFEQVVYDDSLIDPFHPTNMSLSRWDKRDTKPDWVLVGPNEDAHSKQTRTYTVTKAIMFTCKQWYRVAYHLLFRYLFLSDITRLPPLCLVLDQYAWLGWYVKRLHLVRYYTPRRFTIAHVENMLVTVIHHCPNLELFTVEWPITPSFPAIADSLVSFTAKSLRSVHWKIGPHCLAGLIWALDALPSLVSVSIDFENPSTPGTSAEDASDTLVDASPLLGTASHISLSLDSLQQLTVRGLSQEFIEQAIGWSFPFLKNHGAQLTFLDLNTIPALDLPAILAACPMLTSFSFNPDWRLPFHADWSEEAPTTLLREPHARITHLGLHQLLHAFLPVGGGAQIATMLLQRTNDLTFSQLTRRLFPALKVDEGYARWERWEGQCKAEGVRLEDCTGALLGDLPLDSDDEWEADSEEDEYEEVVEKDAGLRPSNVKELRDLLEEIRRMSVSEPTPFLSEEGFAAIL
ncbi:hypothetical protein BJY52DRAFT_1352642 [Lactarius psammicola]|nr:hypothetical protein BJY52DRAFT_1352642 [Lactarius psammicola]